MGSEDFYPEERPVREVEVDGFWMDEHPVTVAEFGASCGRRLRHVAESAPDPEDYPDADPELLVPGSLVFRRRRAGAARRLPQLVGVDARRVLAAARGPGIDDQRPRPPSGRPRRVRGRRTRTRPGRGRSSRPRPSGSTRRAAGSTARCSPGATELPEGSDGEHLAGRVPVAEPEDRRLRGHVAGRFASRPTATASTTCCGNVWEWTSDCPARPRQRRAPARAARAGATPVEDIPRRVIKGGSHLCAPNYCLRYRPAARQGEAVDTSTGHIGFRCIVRTT